MRPLVFLVADKNMEFVLRGFFFGRQQWHRILGCALFDFKENDIVRAVGQNDPGLFARASELLLPIRNRYRHAVVMIDADWGGSPGSAKIQKKMEDHFSNAGWHSENSLVLVHEPEIENWIWSDSPHTSSAMGWENWEQLREALETNQWLEPGSMKPSRPKEAAEWALRKKRIPRSSALYKKITAHISVNRCQDRAFRTLRETLKRWFPPG